MEISKNQSAIDLSPHLGFLNRQAHVFWNGKELGYFQYPGPVEVMVPSALVKEGVNVITVRLSNQWGKATVHGSPDMFGIKNLPANFYLSFARNWEVMENLEPVPTARPMYVNQPGFLFNGMVAPIIPYGIKSFIWIRAHRMRPGLNGMLSCFSS